MLTSDRLKEVLNHFVAGEAYPTIEVRLLATLMESPLTDAGGLILSNGDLTASFNKIKKHYVCQSINLVSSDKGSRN